MYVSCGGESAGELFAGIKVAAGDAEGEQDVE